MGVETETGEQVQLVTERRRKGDMRADMSDVSLRDRERARWGMGTDTGLCMNVLIKREQGRLKETGKRRR